jgi:hypothetical protein
VSSKGSIDLEVIDRSPDVASARMRRVSCGNAPGELQLVLSSSHAAICASCDLDSDLTRGLGLYFASAKCLASLRKKVTRVARGVPPQIFCHPDGRTKPPSQFCDCLVPIIKNLARIRRIIVVWVVVGDRFFVDSFVYHGGWFGVSGGHCSYERWP